MIHEAVAEARDDLSVLSRCLVAIGASRDLDEVLEQVVRAARELLGTDPNLVWLVEGGDTLVLRASSGTARHAPAEVRLAGPGPWASLLASGGPRGPEPMTLTGPAAVRAGLTGVASALVVPLVTKGRPLGVLVAASPTARRFSTTEETLTRALAGHAAVALENARLVEWLLHSERLSTVGRMVAGVAHELNNPLAVILGTLDLIRHEPVDPRTAERLDRLTGQAQRAVAIVRTLLTLARRRPPQRSAIDVNDLLGEALELTAYDSRHADVRVVRQFRVGLPPVLADPGQLQQVFANLFLNAFQAMRQAPTEAILTVTTDLDDAGEQVLVTVADSGAGIAAEHLPHVFEPFFTTKAEGQGTGLGLAICRRIVEHHEGRITVESRPGEGARFTVALPILRTPARPAPSPPVEASAPTGTLDVLLVEDEELVADMLADILTLDGHRVERATNGREALARVRTRRYDLIVSDVRMPDLGGPAFYHELRQLDPSVARRVVFVTGDVVSPDTRSFLEQTGVAYLEKPFAVSDFGAAVRRVLSQP